ncbi:spore cortex-lytic enzyme [Feifania hominis]|uniref:Spore cortex-lytic enzyme n=1 Tax=Feifania hominis TaxID=2763660 RepID=A0A926DE76_9FIRM|nr:spore cortex-lytic enzyme [Feifania hominis]MBC8536581.1 spore cortex-lytic enzyme [Feifania hominis]
MLSAKRYRFLLQLLILILVNLLVIGVVRNVMDERSVAALSRYGSTGSEVTAVQQKLQALGLYAGSIDGIYGSGTEAAVRKFQQQRGLSVDGIAGPATLSALGITGSSGSSDAGAGLSSEMRLLARIISAEARGEPYQGQVAVGAVILNRVEHSSFPNTLAGVIYQPGAFTAIVDGQFNEPVADSAYRAAQDAVNGWDPTGGAIYYYNPVTATNEWIRSRPIIKVIGRHVFCS